MDDIDNVKIEETTDNLDAEITMDVNSTFERMANKRYVQVLQWMLVDGYNADEVADRLGVTVANVYNIKHRAIVQFVEVYNAH
jgi:DNA-directed RNA polymerase specialized sigma24 family protein